MRIAFRAAATAAFCLVVVPPAHAQGFLKRLADRALQTVEQQAERVAERGSGGEDLAPRTTDRSAPPDVMTPRAVRGAAPRDAAPTAPVPAPEAGTVKYPSRLPKPEGFDATKEAFDAFGKVRCTSCEGGYAYDSWPVFPRDGVKRPYNGSQHPLGVAPIGHVHRWNGSESRGSITIVSEETVSGFRCRRLHYRLVKGNASAERPGLLCWGYANEYAGSEGWNPVY